MKTLAFSVLLLLHGGLLLGGGGLWRFEICMEIMEKRELALGSPSRGGGGLEKGLQAPPPPQGPSKFFGSPNVAPSHPKGIWPFWALHQQEMVSKRGAASKRL